MREHQYLLRAAFYILLVVLLECVQTYLGQPAAHAFRDSFHFACALPYLVSTSIGIIGVFLICSFETGDTAAYFFIGKPMDRRFIEALDPMYPIRGREWGILMWGVIPVIAVFAVTLLPFYLCQQRKDKQERVLPLTYLLFLLFVALRWYLLIDGDTFDEPRFVTDVGVRQFDNLKLYFHSPIKVRMKSGIKPKNLIELIPESFELQFLGAYNKRGYNKSLPFLSALSKNSTFCPNVHVGVRTSYSAGSIFASQCGLPLVASPRRGNNAEMLKKVDRVKCAGDYLKQLGYRSVAIYPGDANFGGIKSILMNHGFDEFVHHEQGVRRDDSLMRYFEKWFPKVVEESKREGRPFYLFMGLEDTHPPAFRTSCRVRSEYVGDGENKCIRSFDCMDQRMETIMRMISDQGLTAENTVVLIHGDHPLMPTMKYYQTSLAGRQVTRKLAFIFPFRKRQEIHKRLTVYDITPTLFDELQIEYSPAFPFGRSAFRDETGQEPTSATVDFLWRYLNLE